MSVAAEPAAFLWEREKPEMHMPASQLRRMPRRHLPTPQTLLTERLQFGTEIEQPYP